MARNLSGQHPSRLPTRRNQKYDEQTGHSQSQQRVSLKRSVSSLSAVQLERKRANDREAQRQIRQRNKDRIDGLERQIDDLRRENERLNKCLRQKPTRDMESPNKQNNLDVNSTTWIRSKEMHLPHDRRSLMQDDPISYCSSQCEAQRSLTLVLIRTGIPDSAHETQQRGSPLTVPHSFAISSTAHQPHASPNLEMDINASAYYISTSAGCSSAEKSLEDGQVPYQRALPMPIQSCLSSPYQATSTSTVTRYCVLPNGQPHLILPARQTEDVSSRRNYNQADWSL